MSIKRRRIVQTALDPETFVRLKVQLAREGETVAGFLAGAVENHLAHADYDDSIEAVRVETISTESL